MSLVPAPVSRQHWTGGGAMQLKLLAQGRGWLYAGSKEAMLPQLFDWKMGSGIMEAPWLITAWPLTGNVASVVCTEGDNHPHALVEGGAMFLLQSSH